jgi:glutathione S-transferase
MITLYYASGSPFAWRVHLALEEKGLAYEACLLSFDRGELKSPGHLARHPHGKVPALSDGALTLYESSAIVEYLEDRYPRPSLLPADPAARAHVRIEELEATLYFSDAFRELARQRFSTPPERRDEVALADGQRAVRGQLERLEVRGATRGTAWIVGDALSRADLTWLPFVELAARAGVELDPVDLPWLLAWRERLRARPSYVRSYPPHWAQS